MKTLEDIFGIKIDNQHLFECALTHPSYAIEHNLSPLEHYERLEFLGDAVLKYTVSDIMFKMYPDYTEGQLTKIRSVIVSDNMLAQICKKLKIHKLIKLAKNEEYHGFRELESIKACAFEAVWGAFHMDGKLPELIKFMEKVFVPYIENINDYPMKYNAKAVLQEYTQKLSKEIPCYRLVSTNGPAHDKTFNIEVSYKGKLIGKGHGKTKKEAEQMAALKACNKLGVMQCKKS